MSSFLLKARQTCDELDSLIENVKTKYVNVLSYFGEEPSLASHDFFSTLSKFISEFVACRDVLERQRKAEAKRTQRTQVKNFKQTNAPTPLLTSPSRFFPFRTQTFTSG